MRVAIYWVGGVPTGRLAVLPRPRGGDWLDDEVRALRAGGVDVVVSLLTRDETVELDLVNEPACCAAHGLEFVTFPLPDRGVPDGDAGLLSLVRTLTARLTTGKAVAIHCRQGVGRAALVAACVLAALGERPTAAFDRIAAARGCPVPDTAEQRAWVTRFVERHLTSAAEPVGEHAHLKGRRLGCGSKSAARDA